MAVLCHRKPLIYPELPCSRRESSRAVPVVYDPYEEGALTNPGTTTEKPDFGYKAGISTLLCAMLC